MLEKTINRLELKSSLSLQWKAENAKVNQSQQVAKSVICHSCSVPDVGDLGGKGNSRT